MDELSRTGPTLSLAQSMQRAARIREALIDIVVAYDNQRNELLSYDPKDPRDRKLAGEALRQYDIALQNGRRICNELGVRLPAA